MNITEPRYEVGQIAKGRVYGEFAIVGRMWSDTMGEWVYGCFEVRNNDRVPGEMRFVESTFR